MLDKKSYENQFEDKYDKNSAYFWYKDYSFLNYLWTRFLVDGGTFVNRYNSSTDFLDEAYYLKEDYPNDNGFSENIYIPDDIQAANFFCDDDVSMVLYKNPFDYVSLHLDNSNTNLVTLERIQGSIISSGIGTTTIGIATTNISSYISCAPLAIDNVKINTNTFDIGFVDGGSGNTNIRGDTYINQDLDVKNDFRINTNKFTVDGSTGDTYIGRDLEIERYITADSYYGNGSTLTGIVAGTVGSDGQIPYNNSGSLNGASQLYYDDINNRVGIGTSVPLDKLHVIGNIRSTSFNGVTISVVGNTLTFAVAGVGSTSLTLS